MLRLFFNDRRQFVSEPSKRERLLASVTNRVTDAQLANESELSKLEEEEKQPMLRLFFNDRRQFVSEPSKCERLLASVTNRVTDGQLANSM